jgi:hypothetical protein
MNTNRTKLKILALIASVLMVTSIAMMTVTVQAQEQAHGGNPTQGYEGPSTIPAGQTADFTINSQAFLSISPNPIGVGQELLVNVWTTFPSGEGKYQTGYTVHITKPDGTTDAVNLKSYVADGTSWFTYVPDQVGDWKFQFTFAGEWFPAGYYISGQYGAERTGQFANAIYNPSVYVSPAESPVITLTVQSDYVISWHSPLPTDYWTRPIQPNNREWNTIAGNYPWMGAIIAGIDGQCSWDDEWYGPYVTAPNTPHFVWTRVGAVAGIIGGETGQYYMSGNPGTPDVIFMGRCYDTRTSFVTNVPTTSAACYDLRTGEVYYAIPTSAGGVTPQYINYWFPTAGGAASTVPGSEASSGVTVELWSLSGNRLYKINPTTGAVTTNVSLPSDLGSTYFVRNGYVLSYRSVSTDYIYPAEGIRTARSTTGYLVNWSTQGSSSNFNSRIVSNLSITIPNSLRTIYQTGSYGQLGAYDPDTGISVFQDRFIYGGYYGSNFAGVNMVTGQMLWNVSTNVNIPEDAYRPTNAWCRHGIYVAEMELGYWQARDENTGKVLWTTHMNDYPWGEFWMYDEAAYQDILYGVGYTGVWALNETNGDVVFHYVDPAIPFETPYNSANNTESCYSVQNIRVADGKVYVQNSEHTPSQPATRGWGLICLDALTGEKLWKISGTAMGPGPAADGYMVASSSYDGTTYCLGKGPSHATVTVSEKTPAQGSKVLIEGTVMDMSPAQPNTPCIADQYMDTWMDYLHLQMPVDGLFHNITVTGVDVLLVATDSNGASTTVGTATSDTSGNYAIEWTPPAEGMYTITAIFSGSDSYGSSTATTALSVGPAPTTGTENPPPTESQADNTMLLYGILGAVIVAIILAAVAIIVVLKKR